MNWYRLLKQSGVVRLSFSPKDGSQQSRQNTSQHVNWYHVLKAQTNIPEITGEYWIDNGSVQYADGDVGDYNHESLAIQSVCSNFSDQLTELAETLGVTGEADYWGRTKYLDEENPDVESLLQKLREQLELKQPNVDPDAYIQEAIGANDEVYHILCGGGDASHYMIINKGWIAVRGHNVELYDYNAQKGNLASGLGEIIEQEGGHEEFDPSQVEFYISDYKTGKTLNATLADIEGIETNRPQANIVPQTPSNPITDNRFIHVAPDAQENMPTTSPIKPPVEKGMSAYENEARKKNISLPFR